MRHRFIERFLYPCLLTIISATANHWLRAGADVTIYLFLGVSLVDQLLHRWEILEWLAE